jgi:hypothetical protein
VISLESAKAAKLARNKVMKTEKKATSKLFRAGVYTEPVSTSLLKFSKFQDSGSASGSEIILRSLLKAPMMTIEHGMMIATAKTVSNTFLIIL